MQLFLCVCMYVYWRFHLYQQDLIVYVCKNVVSISENVCVHVGCINHILCMYVCMCMYVGACGGHVQGDEQLEHGPSRPDIVCVLGWW